MTRDETLNFIMTSVLYHIGKTYVIVVPTQDDRKEFSIALLKKLEEIPLWLRPTLKYRTQRHMLFENGMRLVTVLSTNELRGMTINSLFADRRMAQNEEWLEFTTFLVLSGSMNQVTYFDL